MEREKSWKRRQEMDMLSSLPDNLIHHILSFMDIKYAVQTCILSKRWINLWMRIPVVNFSNKSVTKLEIFETLILNVLDKLETDKLSALQFHNHKWCSLQDYIFRRAIRFAVAHKAEKIDISLANKPWFPLALPTSFFKCQSLKILKIEGSMEICKFPLSLDWVSLTKLSLSKLTLDVDQHHCFDVFSKCLNLRNLELHNVAIYQKAFIISAPRLVYLTINNLEITSRSPGVRRLEITAPNLGWFNFRASRPMLLLMVDSPLLKQVDFGINSLYPCKGQEDARNLVDMIRQFGSARTLVIPQEVIEVLSRNTAVLGDEPSPFVNLESLYVKKGRGELFTISLPLMNFFLGGSPSAIVKIQMDFPYYP